MNGTNSILPGFPLSLSPEKTGSDRNLCGSVWNNIFNLAKVTYISGFPGVGVAADRVPSFNFEVVAGSAGWGEYARNFRGSVLQIIMDLAIFLASALPELPHTPTPPGIGWRMAETLARAY